MSKQLTTEEFILRSIKTHGNFYDYSLSVYTGIFKKIIIICPIHGEFFQSAKTHMDGAGCPQCGLLKQVKSTKDTTESFKIKAIRLHGDKYDYSKVVYINNHTKVEIICPIHGSFWQLPLNHLKPYGCQQCAIEEQAKKRTKTTEFFVNECIVIHGDKDYDLSEVDYVNQKTKVRVKCKTCGKSYLQRPDVLLRGCGCPYCKFSKGEKVINDFLIANKIKFYREKKFENCKYRFQLPFDFYLPNQNLLIEFDGIQHYRGTNFTKKAMSDR